jgi:hypothetical protein
MPSNAYSRRWHETFSRDRGGSADVALLARWLPPGRVLDVFCGYGSPRSNLRTHPVCALARSFGYEPALELVGLAPEGGPLVEVAVIEART